MMTFKNATLQLLGWFFYPELLVEHCLVICPDGVEVCQSVLACIIQVTLQLLQCYLCPLV